MKNIRLLETDCTTLIFWWKQKKEIFLIEYKNANIPGAAKPEAFDPMEQGRLKKIAFKYHDSWIYLKAAGKDSKPLTYVYILEYPHRRG